MIFSHMPECPHCGRWFKTKGGLKQHISRSHTVNVLGTKILDPSTIDPIGKMERREEEKETGVDFSNFFKYDRGLVPRVRQPSHN